MRKLLLLLPLLFLLGSCDDVTYVERVVLVNPTDYQVLVDVKGAADSSWQGLGIAKRQSETLVQEVIDQGDTWIFRFSYVGEAAGEDRISRSSLMRERWRYQIPERIGELLKEKGYAPSVG